MNPQVNEGHFRTAQLDQAKSNWRSRNFAVTAGVFEAALISVPDTRIPDVRILRDPTAANIDFKLPLIVATPDMYDNAIRDIILQQQPWVVVEQNYNQVCTIGNYLSQNPGHDAVALASGAQIGLQGIQQFRAGVVNKDTRTIGANNTAPADWFDDKTQAAIEALDKLRMQLDIYSDEIVRLRGINHGRLHVDPPVVGGFTLREQIYLLEVANLVTRYGYERQYIC